MTFVIACGPNRLLQWIQKIEQVKNTSKLSINSYPVHGRVPDEAILLWPWTLDNQNWIILISSKHWLNGELKLSRWNQNYLYKLKIILIKVDKLRVNFNFIPCGSTATRTGLIDLICELFWHFLDNVQCILGSFEIAEALKNIMASMVHFYDTHPIFDLFGQNWPSFWPIL